MFIPRHKYLIMSSLKINHSELRPKLEITVFTLQHVCKTSKGKAFPLQAWSGPECSRKFRFPDFMTTAQDFG